MRKLLPYLLMMIVLSVVVLADTISYDDFECNGFGCGTGWNGNWSYTGACDITTLSSPQGTYMLRGVSTCTATRNFGNNDYTGATISFWATASSLEAGNYCRYYYYDGSTYTQLLQLADGQDTGALQYYSYNVTPVNSNAGVRMQTVASTGDYCYIDTITTSGTPSVPLVNINMDEAYPVSKQNVQIGLSSAKTNTNYTIRLYDGASSLFCEKTVISPSVAQTTFSVYCNMPATPQTNARAVAFETASPSINNTRYFNVVNYQKDTGKLAITQVYYSPQVLQGSSTEIFALIDTTGVTLSKLYVMITFPDNATRRLSMEPTINEGEYRAFITDTYRTTWTNFEIRAEANIYYDTYNNSYYVVPFSVDYVAQVGQVNQVTTVTDPVSAKMASIEVMGTEYIPNEQGTIFLQLSDDQGLPELNGNCKLDIFEPSSVNTSHPYRLSDAPMLYNGNDDGVYFYDLTIPNSTGVYMLSATCSYSFAGAFVYSLGGTETAYPTKTVIAGTFSGSDIFLNDYEDWIYTSCTSTGGATRYCDAYYDFNASLNIPLGDLKNVTEMNLYYMGEASNPATATFYVWNWTNSSWKALPNTLKFSGGSSTPLGIGDFASNLITGANSTISPTGTIRIKVTAAYGHSFTMYNNWLNIKILTTQGLVHDLKGSSEIHVSEFYNKMKQEFSEVPAEVWNYTTRNLTYYPPSTPVGDIAFAVWNYSSRNLTYYQDVTNYTLIPQVVWDYTTRNLTYYPNDTTSTAVAVWTYATRDLTYYQMPNNEQIALAVWNSTTRNLTYYPATDTTGIGLAVWNYTTRNLTYYPLGLQASEVWEYANRNLTYYEPVDTDAVALAVWNHETRNLTYLPFDENTIALAVWDYTTRNLTYYPLGLQASEVWEYATRNLTYYPTQLDLTNYSRISNLTAYDVWNFDTRNLTYYPDVFINTTSIAESIWDYNGTININVLAQVADAIWEYVGRYIDGILG